MKLKVHVEQRRELFRLMEKHFYSSEEIVDVKNKKIIWNGITKTLNALGPSRVCAKWRKFWTDTLLRARKKIVLRHNLSYGGKFSERMRKVEYTKEDLEVIRIAGGEEKLISEFRPRANKSFYKVKHKNIPVYCIDDSNPTSSSDFDITNQPVSEDFYEINQSKDIDNSTNDSDIMQVEVNVNLNNIEQQSIQQSSTVPIVKPIIISSTSSNYKNHNKQPQKNSRHRRKPSKANINYRSNENSNSSSIKINESHLESQCVTNFDIIEDNASFNIDNNTNNLNISNSYSPEYSADLQLPPLAPIIAVNQNISQEQQQAEFRTSEITFNAEMLNVQKETLIEIRKLSQIQQETNQLLTILLHKFDNNSERETKNISEVTLQTATELSQTQLNDISTIVVKGER